MKIDRYEVIGETSKDVKIAPLLILSPEMQLHNNLIDIVKIVRWEIFERRILSPFNIHFYSEVLPCQVMNL
jgi:hypothetical protein